MDGILLLSLAEKTEIIMKNHWNRKKEPKLQIKIRKKHIIHIFKWNIISAHMNDTQLKKKQQKWAKKMAKV